MAILAVPEELHQRFDSGPTTTAVGSSFVYTRQYIRMNASTLMGIVRKSEILVHIVFSQQATLEDVGEFVQLITGTNESESGLQYICKHVERLITESALDALCDKRFSVILIQLSAVWKSLLSCEGQSRETSCRALVLTLLDAIRLICTTLGVNYDILLHYEVYERLGTLSSIFRDWVNQISLTGAKWKTGEVGEYERFQSDWVVRAIGKTVMMSMFSLTCTKTVLFLTPAQRT